MHLSHQSYIHEIPSADRATENAANVKEVSPTHMFQSVEAAYVNVYFVVEVFTFCSDDATVASGVKLLCSHMPNATELRVTRQPASLAYASMFLDIVDRNATPVAADRCLLQSVVASAVAAAITAAVSNRHCRPAPRSPSCRRQAHHRTARKRR